MCRVFFAIRCYPAGMLHRSGPLRAVTIYNYIHIYIHNYIHNYIHIYIHIYIYIRIPSRSGRGIQGRGGKHAWYLAGFISRFPHPGSR